MKLKKHHYTTHLQRLSAHFPLLRRKLRHTLTGTALSDVRLEGDKPYPRLLPRTERQLSESTQNTIRVLVTAFVSDILAQLFLFVNSFWDFLFRISSPSGVVPERQGKDVHTVLRADYIINSTVFSRIPDRAGHASVFGHIRFCLPEPVRVFIVCGDAEEMLFGVGAFDRVEDKAAAVSVAADINGDRRGGRPCVGFGKDLPDFADAFFIYRRIFARFVTRF